MTTTQVDLRQFAVPNSTPRKKGKLRVPLTDTRAAWLSGIDKELAWWRAYFTKEGLHDPAGYHERLDPSAPLQPHLVAALPDRPPGHTFQILDCAAGPATTVGKMLGDQRVEVVAVDALADHYRKMLDEIGLTPPVPTISGEVEHLDEQFAPASFDLVHMRFALDHCYNPLEALRQMTRVTRDGGAVLIEHYRDASEVTFEGLRQWELRPVPGDLVVANADDSFSVRDSFPEFQVAIEFSPTWLTLTLRRA